MNNFVNIERTNNTKPICLPIESLNKKYFFDIDTGIPFEKITVPTKLNVGCLYDITYKLNEDDCSCEGDLYTYLVIKAEPKNTYYIAEFVDNKIYRTNIKNYDIYTHCHAKDVLGFDLDTIEYEPLYEPMIVELPTIPLGGRIYVKAASNLNDFDECVVAGLLFAGNGWNIMTYYDSLPLLLHINDENKTWVRNHKDAIERFTSKL